MKKVLIFLLIVQLSAAIGCTNEEGAVKKTVRQVKTMKIIKKSEFKKVRFPGIVRAYKRANLSFDVPGRIVMLNAREGLKVQKGDVLAQLNDQDYKNKYQAALANMKEACLALERYEKLFEKGVIARAGLDRVEKAAAVAKARMRIAEKAFENTKLKAYFSGTIAARYVENFQNIQAKQPIVSMEDTSILEIVVHVPEKSVIKTRKKDIVSMYASFDAIDGAAGSKKFSLDLKEISTKADPATRTYAVVFTMPGVKGYNIFTGMTAMVEITVMPRGEKSRETIVIPVTAVMGNGNNNALVWIYSPGNSTVSSRKVTIGEIVRDKIYVKSGLEGGEIIVTAGVHYLVDGMKVKELKGMVGK